MADEYREVLKPGGHPAERQLEYAERDRDIIDAVVRGQRVTTEFAKSHGLSVRQVQRIILDASRAARAAAADLATQAYLLMHERLERLYRLVEFELEQYERYMLAVRQAQAGAAASGQEVRAVGFDDRPFRVAVMIFERQAKLHGTDAKAASDGKGGSAWITDSPIEQVVDYAKSLKMNLPSQFKT